MQKLEAHVECQGRRAQALTPRKPLKTHVAARPLLAVMERRLKDLAARRAAPHAARKAARSAARASSEQSWTQWKVQLVCRKLGKVASQIEEVFPSSVGMLWVSRQRTAPP